MKVKLTIVRGPEAGRVLEFTEPRGFVIGRADDADLRLSPDDPYVSRRHVYLEICPPRLYLQNLGTRGSGSTNAPHVNGEAVPYGRRISDGDLIELGYTLLRVSSDPGGAAPPGTCPICRQPLDVSPAGEEHVGCARCSKSAEDGPIRDPVETSCGECGRDLTKQANSDGRAALLRAVVQYRCETCVERSGILSVAAVGAYDILDHLGEGGMGTVYRAYHRATARVVALKQIKDLADAPLVQRFDREMRLLQSLCHENIVRAIDAGVDSRGQRFLVTEFVGGGDLASMAEQRPLSHPFLVRLAGRILAGMEYLHSQKIIHRDIKPQNILLDGPATENSDPTPKIADFGLAFSYARAGGTRCTKPGTGLGTLMYMPPEQVRDATTVRESADVYAFGVTLYFLLTGCYTFDFPTPQDVAELQKRRPALRHRPDEALQHLIRRRRVAHPFNIILSEEPIPIHERDSSVSPDLARVVDRAVLKDPAERFQTAAQLRAALSEVAAWPRTAATS